MTHILRRRELLLAATAGDAHAQLATDVFVRAVSAAVAAMTTSLGGLDALRVHRCAGEGSSLLRALVCARLEHLGVELDVVRNAGSDESIGASGARVVTMVVPAGEEIVIARQAARLLDGPGGGSDIRGDG